MLKNRKKHPNYTLIETEWEEIRQLQKNQTVVSGTVVSIKKYGAFVKLDIGGVGLLHATEMFWHQFHSLEAIKERYEIDQKLDVVIIEADSEELKMGLVVNRLGQNPYKTQKDQLAVGEIVNGKVINVTQYGAFLEIESGVVGMLHTSEMSYKSLRKKARKKAYIQEHFHLGDLKTVMISSVDIEKRKISLSIKQLLPDPWMLIDAKYSIGQVLKGIVSEKVGFGFFVDIEEGLEGLVHKNEFTSGITESSVQLGEEINVEILSIDKETRKMGLRFLDSLER